MDLSRNLGFFKMKNRFMKLMAEKKPSFLVLPCEFLMEIGKTEKIKCLIGYYFCILKRLIKNLLI